MSILKKTLFATAAAASLTVAAPAMAQDAGGTWDEACGCTRPTHQPPQGGPATTTVNTNSQSNPYTQTQADANANVDHSGNSRSTSGVDNSGNNTATGGSVDGSGNASLRNVGNASSGSYSGAQGIGTGGSNNFGDGSLSPTANGGSSYSDNTNNNTARGGNASVDGSGNSTNTNTARGGNGGQGGTGYGGEGGQGGVGYGGQATGGNATGGRSSSSSTSEGGAVNHSGNSNATGGSVGDTNSSSSSHVGNVTGGTSSAVTGASTSSAVTGASTSSSSSSNNGGNVSGVQGGGVNFSYSAPRSAAAAYAQGNVGTNGAYALCQDVDSKRGFGVQAIVAGISVTGSGKVRANAQCIDQVHKNQMESDTQAFAAQRDVAKIYGRTNVTVTALLTRSVDCETTTAATALNSGLAETAADAQAYAAKRCAAPVGMMVPPPPVRLVQAPAPVSRVVVRSAIVRKKAPARPATTATCTSVKAKITALQTQAAKLCPMPK